MHLMIALHARKRYISEMQMTIRNIPPEVRRRIEADARSNGRSLNEAAILAMARGLGCDPQGLRKWDFSFFTMTEADAAAIEDSVARGDAADVSAQRREKKKNARVNRNRHQPVRRSGKTAA